MIDPVQIGNEFHSAPPARHRRWIEAFLSAEGPGGRYVVGRNPEANRVAEALEIEGLVDDTVTPGSCWGGRPMLRAEQLPVDALVVSCPTSMAPVSVRRRLAAVGVMSMDYCDLCRVEPEYFALNYFVTDTRVNPDAHAEAWGRLTVMNFVLI